MGAKGGSQRPATERAELMGGTGHTAMRSGSGSGLLGRHCLVPQWFMRARYLRSEAGVGCRCIVHVAFGCTASGAPVRRPRDAIPRNPCRKSRCGPPRGA